MEDLVGKKVKGFKFSGNNIGYNLGVEEEELTIEQILNNIKKLTSEL